MENRFMKHVNKKENDCWDWLGHKDHLGYGRFNIDGKIFATHRVSYELYKGEIPKGLVIRHMCNNRKCVNPNHLETGTQKDNLGDAVKSGTMLKKITLEQKQQIFNLLNQKTVKEIANMFNLTDSHIYRMKRNNVDKEIKE